MSAGDVNETSMVPTQNILSLALCCHNKNSTTEDISNVVLDCINASHDTKFADINAYLKTEFSHSETVRHFLTPSIPDYMDDWEVYPSDFEGDLHIIQNELGLSNAPPLTQDTVKSSIVVIKCDRDKVKNLGKKPAGWAKEIRGKLDQCASVGWTHTLARSSNRDIIVL